MTRRRLYAAICLVTSVFTVDLTACAPHVPSARGLDDPNRHDPLAEDYWELDRVSLGSVLTVTTRDSGEVVGHYDGFDRMPAADYEARYAAWPGDSTMPRPPLGTRIRVERRGAPPDSGRFAGFDFGIVRYQRAGDSKERVALFNTIRRLEDSTGVATTGEKLTTWLIEGRLPLGRRLKLKDHGRTRAIALDRISRLQVHGSPAIVKVAVAAGFVAILIVAFSNRPKPKPIFSDCGGSPQVYVQDPSGVR